jgi:hypothetical protein
MTLLHDLPDFDDLVAVTARRQAIDPGLVEKDYWIMHGLWGLQQLGIGFELKGGTSLSKGYKLIHRFSEDIDILIHPDDALPIGRNQNKPAQVDARRAFYDSLPSRLVIPGFSGAERDTSFDDARMRSAGIRLLYPALNPLPDGVKTGILLEAGFDQVTPNHPCLISSWAYDAAVESGLTAITDNRAIDIACYDPGYTLVEKLQTISTKFRRYRATGDKPQNFLRHYYDVYCLLGNEHVQNFIGSKAYLAHKQARFPAADETVLARNPAFLLNDAQARAALASAYAGTRALYFREQPSFTTLLERISANLVRL